MSTLPQTPKRRDEPSSWAGLAAIIVGLVLASNGLEGSETQEIAGGIAAVVSGVIAIWRRERS